MHRPVFLLIICLCCLTRLTAQTNEPKVGLVLSGGAAKGMAHIGVLKVLEGVGIVPDYITGTSMGAVVGGLYAIGYSPDELEEIALTTDWDVLLGNRTSLGNISVEHKDFYDHYQLVLPIEGFNVGLPQGVIEGQELSDLLTRLTAPVHHINDFDSLPRPFRCIGADITTGDRVVLKSGFIASAIRASMAIPTVFTPVEIDGRMLVDGGLVHNFPVEEVIEMGADIVIGVSVSDSLLDESDLNSLIDILTQSTFIASVKESEEQKKYVDYFIQPPMKPYTAGDFNDADSIIARGEVTAGRMYPILKHLADSLKELRTFEPIIRPDVSPSMIVDTVEINGSNDIDDKFIREKLNIHSGDTITPEILTKSVNQVYGTLSFDKVTYELYPKENNKTDLSVSVSESSPGRASFDLHFDSENGVGIYTTLQYRNLLLRNSRLTLEVDVAERPYFNANYFYYFGDKRTTALSLGTSWFRDNGFIFEAGGSQRTAEYRIDLWHSYLQVQTVNHPDRSYGLRIFTERNGVKPTVIDSASREFDKLRYSNWGLRPFYTKNTLDSWTLPNKGLVLYLSGTVNFNMTGKLSNPDSNESLDYSLLSADAEYRQYFPLGDKLNIHMSHQLRLTNLKPEDLNVSDSYFVGGFKPNFINATSYWGAEKYQYRLASFYKAEFALRYMIIRNLYISAGLSFLETEFPMAWFGDNAFDLTPAGSLDRRGSWMADITFNSFLGPVKLQVTRDFNGDDFIPWFSIGHNIRNAKRP